jgi:hypothetical protein
MVKDMKMKINKSTAVSFILLVLIAALWRVIPGRPMGFAPQIAMAIFGGSVISDRRMSFILPLLSMFISDLLYQILHSYGLSSLPGFYNGQLTNYILFALITVIGFGVKQKNVFSILGGALAGASFYFLSSNFLDWAMGGLDISYRPYPKTLAGLTDCYVAGIPFYKTSIIATLVFSTVLFGGYYLANKVFISKKMVAV